MSAPLHRKFQETVLKTKAAPRTVPVSLRLTPVEKARLIKRAGKTPLSEYMRACLLDSATRGSPVDPQAKAALGKVLAFLGRSEFAASFRDLAYAAKIGALPVDQEIADEIGQACTDIREIRALLIESLQRPVRRI